MEGKPSDGREPIGSGPFDVTEAPDLGGDDVMPQDQRFGSRVGAATRRFRRWLVQQLDVEHPAAPEPRPARSRITGVLGYDETVSYDEIAVGRESKNMDDFTTEEWAAADVALQQHLKDRRARLESAIPGGDPGVVRYGASNWPYFPDDYAADWREALPHDDPRRQIGPPLAIQGTPAAKGSLQKAYDAIEHARRTSES
jgi:hypothetical protein